MKSRTILAAGLLAAAATAQAGTFPSGGVGTGTSRTVVETLGEGHMVMDVHDDYSEFSMENEGNPMSGMSGVCTGSVTVEAGAVTGAGSCEFTDTDGETALIDWTADGMAEDGAIMGQWMTAGGTGKWNDATGGGTFVNQADDLSGFVRNTIDGEITMP